MKLVSGICETWKNCKKSHVLKVEELSRRKLTEDFEAVTSFFQGSNVQTVYNFGDSDAKHPDAEIDDEHTSNLLASPTVPSGARSKCEPVAGLSLTKRRFVSRCTVNFSKYGETHQLDVIKRKSNPELDNCQTRIIFGKTREHLFAEAKSEILRHEYRADLAEYNTCELRRQIESQEVEIGHTRTGYKQSRREQALLHEYLADREPALRDTRTRSIQKLEELKRDGEFRLEEFSTRRMVENYFKDVESVRGGQFFHVPSQPALFPLPREPGGLLSCDENLQPCIWDTHGFSGNVFGWSACEYFNNFFRNVQFKEFLCYGKCSGPSKYGETRHRKWWSRPQPILSQNGWNPQTVLQFSVLISDSWRDHRLEF